MGIECRSADREIHALLAPLHRAETAARVTAERSLNKRLNGGCQVPIACYALLEGEQLWLRGLVGQPDGGLLLRAENDGADAEALGERVAEQLLAQGAEAILQGGVRRVTGWRLLLTRPAAECAALAATLAAAGVFSRSRCEGLGPGRRQDSAPPFSNWSATAPWSWSTGRPRAWAWRCCNATGHARRPTRAGSAWAPPLRRFSTTTWRPMAWPPAARTAATTARPCWPCRNWPKPSRARTPAY